MIERDKLFALVAKPVDPDERPMRTPLPTFAEARYATRNPDSSRKTCASCYKYVLSPPSCVEVAGEIDARSWCAGHVFGTPQATQPAIGRPASRIPQGTARLLMTPAGTGVSCDRCRFFTPDEAGALGLCRALGSIDGEPPIVVDALGACARWQYGGER